MHYTPENSSSAELLYMVMKILAFFALLCLLVAATACSADRVLEPAISGLTRMILAPTATPNNAALPTATPIDLNRQDPNQVRRYPGPTEDCALITQGDVSTAFSAEVNQPIHASNPVDRVIFSPASTSADESHCVYLAFHLSGSAKGNFNQVTYWTDRPDRATPGEWAQVWTEAKSTAAQTVSGIGDGAFYKEGRLTFKKGSTCVTVEVVSTAWNPSTRAGANQQLEIEKRLALKALGRLK
jgi:hypothetical protein